MRITRRIVPSLHWVQVFALTSLLLVSSIDPVASFQSSPIPLQFRRVSTDSRIISFSKGENKNNHEDSPDNSPDAYTFQPADFRQLAKNALAAFLAISISTMAVTSPVKARDEEAIFNTLPTTTTSTATTTSSDEDRAGMGARRYWSIMANNQGEDAQMMKMRANEALLDHAVGTINTMYYDNSGGAYFTPREFYNKWREYRDEARKFQTLASREGAVQGLKYLVSTLNDPYSKYLTREDMWRELHTRDDGFLGIGALVEPPDRGEQFFARSSAPTLAKVMPDDEATISRAWNILKSINILERHHNHKRKLDPQLSAMRVQTLPVVTAVVPDSPAERTGVTVGDRIVAVGDYSFLGQSRTEVSRNFQEKFASGENYFGHPDVTLAKPILRSLVASSTSEQPEQGDAALTKSASGIIAQEREVVIGYRQTRVRLPTKSLEDEFERTTASITVSSPEQLQKQSQPIRRYRPPEAQYALASTSTGAIQTISLPEALTTPPPTKGGNSIVHWELISEQSHPSIFQKTLSGADDSSDDNSNAAPTRSREKVGYIRLTRFSRVSTAGYIEALQSLEQAGATSFIIDVRNNYGGIIQEAMLTASTLIRDPHAVLCYTLNSRGGFTPHDVEEYVVDKRYPGYLLSQEPKWVTLDQVREENPDIFEENGNNWVPPSSFASLHEQTTKRGIHRISPSFSPYDEGDTASSSSSTAFSLLWNTLGTKQLDNHSQQWLAQKNFVILVNEGTASSAEVFASALHDNGRALALIGSKTYGKGLIQHTFPMPDGGGLRLTVAEYLTPALHHVTNVGNARFDPVTGEQVGGGIRPDLFCDSRQGIPSNIGADLCVGMALDVLEEASDYSIPEAAGPKHQEQRPHQQQSPPPQRQQQPPQHHPPVPSQDWLEEKSFFVKGDAVIDRRDCIESSSTLSASSNVSPESDVASLERPVSAKGREDEF